MIKLKIYISLLVHCLNYGSIGLFSIKEEITIQQNNLLAVLQELPKVYDISFEVYLNTFVNGWTSLIHLLSGFECCDGGDRTLSIYFEGNRAEFTSPVNSNWFVTYSTKFKLLEWITVNVNQHFSNSKYIYTVQIGGEIIVTAENTDAQIFKNVRLYVSTPLLNPQPGRIRNINIPNTISVSFFAVNAANIYKNNYLTVIKTLPKEYEIAFEAYFSSYLPSTWSSVLFFGGDGATVRVFEITISNSILYACASVNNSAGYNKQIKAYNLNEWIKFSVKQTLSNGYYTYVVQINRVTVNAFQNTGARAFQDVVVSASAYAAQPGFLRNLVVINACPTCDLLTTLSTNNYDSRKIYLLVNITTNLGCISYLQNVNFYLQAESLLNFKSFVWSDSGLNYSNVQLNGKSFVVNIGKLIEKKYAIFSIVFTYDEQVPNKKSNISIIADFSWNYFCEDSSTKFKNQVIFTPLKKEISPVNKVSPIWNYIQTNGTITSENLQFVCQSMQNRQSSPCYQREISSGVIKFLPIQLMTVIGYDQISTLVYGLTTRSNLIEVDINKKKAIVITEERCLKIPSCERFLRKA